MDATFKKVVARFLEFMGYIGLYFLPVDGFESLLSFFYRRFFVKHPCSELFKHTYFLKLFFESLKSPIYCLVVFNMYSNITFTHDVTSLKQNQTKEKKKRQNNKCMTRFLSLPLGHN